MSYLHWENLWIEVDAWILEIFQHEDTKFWLNIILPIFCNFHLSPDHVFRHWNSTFFIGIGVFKNCFNNLISPLLDQFEELCSNNLFQFKITNLLGLASSHHKSSLIRYAFGCNIVYSSPFMLLISMIRVLAYACMFLNRLKRNESIGSGNDTTNALIYIQRRSLPPITLNHIID